MKKSKIYTLDNGLKLVFYQDNSKHSIQAHLFVKFGGNIKKIKTSNETFNIKDGTAHFLEHLLIEHSPYGNAHLEFEKENIDFNGSTNKDVTNFYINSVYNFDNSLIKLINIVNNPKFNSSSINEVKPAIIKEIMMKKDNKWDDLSKAEYKCLFKDIKYSKTLGEVSDIENIDYEYIKKCYDIFYNTKNQILFIYGNFSINKIKKLISDEYNKISKNNIEYELIKNEESNQVVRKEDYINKDVNREYVRLSYKIDISKFKSKEKIKLTFYIHYFLSNLFGSSSKLYSDLVKKRVCDYNIEYTHFNEDKFLIIQVGGFTNNSKIFIEALKNAMKDKKLSKKNFEREKKNSILNLILREDYINGLIYPFIDNILTFDYYEMDTLEDIYEQNFNDYKNIINSLDFSNYCIVKMINRG